MTLIIRSKENHGMAKIGYAAMLEQFHPTDLLDWCAQAEAAGFSAGFMVDRKSTRLNSSH